MFKNVIILFSQDPCMCSVWSSHHFFYCVSFSVVYFKHAIRLGMEYPLPEVVKGYKEVLITL